jgi:hypothetical protein
MPHKSKYDQTEERNENKTWTTFTYYCPKIRKVANILKHTNLSIAFKNTNTLQQLKKPKTNNKTLEYDNSGIYKLKCNTRQISYIGQTSPV